jgi:hypothetical protein
MSLLGVRSRRYNWQSIGVRSETIVSGFFAAKRYVTIEGRITIYERALSFLIGNLFVHAGSGKWQGLQLEMDRQRNDTCHERIGLHARLV